MEMVINEDLYVKKHHKSGIRLVSPDYPVAVRECAKDQEFSSGWTIDAAASVLRTKIVSVYPPVNGMLDKTVSILHTTFNPNKDCLPRPPIFVMWSSCSLPRTGVTWTTNHFTPLLRTKPAEMINLDGSENVEVKMSDTTNASTPRKKVN